MKQLNYDNLSPDEAIAYQQQLRTKIQIHPLEKGIKTIGGADMSFNKYTEIVYAGIVVLRYPDLQELEKVSVTSKTSFPYIPGLLAFREVPALLEVLELLKNKPDLMILDGQGITHERRTGIATHFGLLTDIPSIGCAKSRLFGRNAEPEGKSLAYSPIKDGNELLGYALRTKKGCKPVYVSPGHKVSVEESLEIMINCTRNYRIPEPTRKAHLFVNSVRMAEMQGNSQLNLFGMF